MDSRRKFTAMFKLRVIEYAEQTNNCAAAREFKVSEKSVRDWKKLSAQLKLLPKNKCANRGKCSKWPQLEVEVAKHTPDTPGTPDTPHTTGHPRHTHTPVPPLTPGTPSDTPRHIS
ncbi:Pogo transposable element-like 86 [Homarus americanus]|uniref:Pogo transposable element-like 86 n=1 Tax=Homarus americanus TaxID=6706 RepID=A0A8J5MQW1_HOMAM|nr:Pogo transposable element-like 86 [Homarus americanus]